MSALTEERAWAALRRVDRLEERSRLGRRRQVLEERERKATEQWERDTADLRAACQELGAPGVPELQELAATTFHVRKLRSDPPHWSTDGR